MAPPSLSHYKQLQRRPSSEHPISSIDQMNKTGTIQNSTSYGMTMQPHEQHSEMSRVNQSTPGG